MYWDLQHQVRTHLTCNMNTRLHPSPSLRRENSTSRASMTNTGITLGTCARVQTYMLCRVWTHHRQGFTLPTCKLSGIMACRLYTGKRVTWKNTCIGSCLQWNKPLLRVTNFQELHVVDVGNGWYSERRGMRVGDTWKKQRKTKTKKNKHTKKERERKHTSQQTKFSHETRYDNIRKPHRRHFLLDPTQNRQLYVCIFNIV